FLLRLIEAGHIRERNFHFVLCLEERRLGFPYVENLSTGTSAACHPAHEHPKPEQQQEEETPLGKHAHVVLPLGAVVLNRGSAWICLYELIEEFVEPIDGNDFHFEVGTFGINAQGALTDLLLVFRILQGLRTEGDLSDFEVLYQQDFAYVIAFHHLFEFRRRLFRQIRTVIQINDSKDHGNRDHDQSRLLAYAWWLGSYELLVVLLLVRHYAFLLGSRPYPRYSY